MKVAQIAVLGVAVVAAGGAYLTANNLTSQPQPVEVSQPDAPRIELAHVLVASEEIALGTSLNDGMMEWQAWPQEAVADGYITRESTPDGLELSKVPAIARATFSPGEPIREGKIVRAGKGYMSAILPAGQVAVATEISTANSAGGFILPNDRVDVIMTREGNEDEGNTFISETILKNVRVLAIDQTVEEKDGESVVVGETATLQLKPKQARILTVAKQMSVNLSLVLRSLEDTGNKETEGAEYLLTGSRGKGRVRVIKYGNRKEVLTGSNIEQN